jgi:hypothetical protein
MALGTSDSRITQNTLRLGECKLDPPQWMAEFRMLQSDVRKSLFGQFDDSPLVVYLPRDRCQQTPPRYRQIWAGGSLSTESRQ